MFLAQVENDRVHGLGIMSGNNENEGFYRRNVQRQLDLHSTPPERAYLGHDEFSVGRLLKVRCHSKDLEARESGNRHPPACQLCLAGSLSKPYPSRACQRR